MAKFPSSSLTETRPEIVLSSLKELSAMLPVNLSSSMNQTQAVSVELGLPRRGYTGLYWTVVDKYVKAVSDKPVYFDIYPIK